MAEYNKVIYSVMLCAVEDCKTQLYRNPHYGKSDMLHTCYAILLTMDAGVTVLYWIILYLSVLYCNLLDLRIVIHGPVICVLYSNLLYTLYCVLYHTVLDCISQCLKYFTALQCILYFNELHLSFCNVLYLL